MLSQAEKALLIQCIERDELLPQEYCAALFCGGDDRAALRLYENATVGLFRTAWEAGRMLSCNQRTLELLGYADRESCLRDFDAAAMYVDPGARDSMLAQLEAHGEVRNVDARIRRVDGTVIWVRLNSRLYRQEGVIEGTAQDVTELLAADDLLRESQARFEQLFHSMTSGFALHEVLYNDAGQPCDYRFLEVNPAFENMTGLRAADVVGRSVLEVLPQTEPYWIETYGAVVQTGVPVEFENYSTELDKYFLVSAYAAGPQRFATVIQDVTARKASQAELERSEQRYRELVEQSQLPIVVLQDFRAVFANNALYDLLGYADYEELRGVKLLQAVDPADHARVIDYYAALIQGQPFPRGVVLTLVAKDGRRIWVEASAEFQEYEGRPAVQLALYDVTQRELARRALEESEQFLRAVMESSPLGISVRSKTGRLLSYNAAWQRIWAIPTAEIVEDMARERAALVLDKRDNYALPWRQELLDLYAHGGTLVLPEARTGGRRPTAAEWVSQIFYAIPDQTGAVDRVVVITLDISERKRMESELRQQDALYRRLVDTAGEGVWAVDRQQVTTFVNPQMAQMLGMTPDEMLERPVTDFMAEDAVARYLERMAQRSTEQHERYEQRLKHRDGSQVICQVSGTALLDEHGQFQGSFGMFTDVTELKRAERELRDSEEKYRSLFENMLNGYAYCRMVYDDQQRPVDFEYLAVNAAFERLTGLKDVVGQKVTQVIPGIAAAHPELFETYGRVAATGEPATFELDFQPLGLCLAISAYSPQPGCFAAIFNDISERRRSEIERETTVQILRLLNTSYDSHELIRAVVKYLRDWTGCEAVGIRLRDKEDFPYFETSGFPERFVQLENKLCHTDAEGRIVRDSTGNPVLDCMCGNVICGRFDPRQPFFTANGSFWSNCTTQLLAMTTEADRQARTRNRCNGEGYESVALIPLRSGGETFGLIQLNDKREDRFTPELIALVERLADSIAKALAEKLAQQALADSERSLRHSQQMAHIGHWTWSPNGAFKCSDEMYRIFGFEPEHQQTSRLLQDFYDAVHPEDRDRVMERHEHVERLGELTEAEYRIVRPDGSVRHFWNVPGATLLDEEGRIVQMSGVVQDITERKIAEQLLLESKRAAEASQAKYEQVVNLIADVVWSYEMDAQGAPLSTYISPAADRLLGLPPGTIRHDLSRYLQYVHPEDLPAITEQLAAGMREIRQNQAADYRLVRPDGGVVWVHTTGSAFTHDTGHITAFGTTADITARKEVESKLLQAKHEWEATFDSVPDMIAIIDPQYRILRVNKAWAQRLQDAFPEYIGRHCYEVLHEADNPPANCPHTQLMHDRKMHEMQSYEPQLKAHFQVTCSPLFDQAGQFMGSVHTMRDITDRISAEEEQQRLEDHLRQIQKLEALGTLAGGIAHDFNNILFAILGNAELLHEDLPPGSDAADKLAQVIAASNRARDLVQQILAFSRRTTRELAPVNMNLVVKEVYKLLRATLPSMIDLQLQLEPVSCVVLADASEMHQVLMNLATNAAQALEDTPGRLEIGLRQLSLSSTEVLPDPLLQPGPYVELKVRDTGVGMPPDVLQRVFEPFYTTKELGRGTGLGLAVVHGIVSRMAGAVRVASTVGQGTEFNVLLPALQQDVVADTPRLAQLPHGSGRVLVVDDEPAVREVVSDMLSHLGYTITTAASGDEALALYLRDTAAFDLVLTDQAMPGMIGLELAQALLEHNPRLPVVLCTGYSNNISALAARSAGIRELLSKPVDLRQLALVMQRLLKEQG